MERRPPSQLALKQAPAHPLSPENSMNLDNPDVTYMSDLRVTSYDPLLPPQILTHELPLSPSSKHTIAKARLGCEKILRGADDRILVIVGPCSIHDVEAALEYGHRLKVLAKKLEDTLLIVMRAYFEKPRTTIGWKGLLNDPFLDGSFEINTGLRIGRKLLCDLTHAGIPVGSELLDTTSPQFIADLISWGAIGARTTECQLHRELASGVSFPIGFKNGTDGNVDIAIDAIHAAAHPHHFMGVTDQGLAAIINTSGNEFCHVILRGGKTGPNYSKDHVGQCCHQLEKAKLPNLLMVDCSHGNSQKNHKNQAVVLKDIASQIASGSYAVMGVMIESNLVAGNQKIPASGPQDLVYGQSITDACVDWPETEHMLQELSDAVLTRRKSFPRKS